ncbi:MAG: hypothetical protein H6Q15_616 [Bacteroidetes bacterium]|nr:hypothetical protein [Bacteroidota bacterium]
MKTKNIEQLINTSLLYIKSHILLIAISILIIFSWFVFEPFWLDLINKLLVVPIISKLTDKSSFWLFIFAFSLITIYYLAVYKYEKRFLKSRFIIFIAASVLYSICLSSNYWIFNSLNGSICLSYANIIYYPLICEVFIYIIRYKKSKIDANAENETSTKLIYEDICTEESDDTYNRKEYIKSITNVIANNFFDRGSFAIGINGCWGNGKSSFVYKIMDEINNKANNECLIIEFKPWYCKNSNDIIEEFFSIYREKISVHIPCLSSEIKKYKNSLLNIASSKLGFNLADISPFFHQSNIQGQYDEISKILKGTKLNVLIVIDDLDRLDGVEIIEVLKLIRNSANFPYTQFIVAYDKEYIKNTLSDNNIAKPEKYLEKIFNLEIILPKFHERIICEELFQLLKENIKLSNNKEMSDEELESLVYTSIDTYIDKEDKYYLIPKILETKRDVIRFTNSFTLNFQAFKDSKTDIHINIRDLFFIELIRYGYYNLYEILRDNPLLILDLYFTHKTYSYKWKDFPSEVEDKLDNQADENEKNTLTRFIDEGKIFVFRFFMEKLFYNNNSDNNISHLRNFDKYFAFQLDKKCITNQEFIDIIDKENAVEKIEEWFRTKHKKEIEEKLFYCLTLIRKKDNPNDTSYILSYKIIYSLYEKLFESKNQDLLLEVLNSIESHIRKMLVIDIDHLICLLELWMNILQNKNLETFITGIKDSDMLMSILLKGNLRVGPTDLNCSMIEKALTETKAPMQISEMISIFLENQNKSNISKDKLTIPISGLYEIQKSYLNKYIKNPDPNISSYKLFNYYAYNNPNQITEILKNYKEYILTERNDYLNHLFNKIVSSDPEWFVINIEPFYSQFFNIPEELDTFLSSNISNENSNNIRARNFWEIFKNNDFKEITFKNQGTYEDMVKNNFNYERKKLDELLDIQNRLNRFESISIGGGYLNYIKTGIEEIETSLESNNLYIRLRGDIIEQIKNLKIKIDSRS